MSFLEPLAFCSIEEYRRFEDGRVSFSSIERGQLYTYMARLEGENREAARVTLRIVGAVAVERTVDVLFHDERLEELFEVRMKFDDHEYGLPASTVRMHDKRHNTASTISEGYLKDYYEEIYDHMLLSSVSMPIEAPIGT